MRLPPQASVVLTRGSPTEKLDFIRCITHTLDVKVTSVIRQTMLMVEFSYELPTPFTGISVSDHDFPAFILLGW